MRSSESLDYGDHYKYYRNDFPVVIDRSKKIYKREPVVDLEILFLDLLWALFAAGNY